MHEHDGACGDLHRAGLISKYDKGEVQLALATGSQVLRDLGKEHDSPAYKKLANVLEWMWQREMGMEER